MKHILLTITLIFGATFVNAAEHETWLCDGYRSTGDGSTYLGPFIMYGDKKRYEYKHAETGWINVLSFVGENLVGRFTIYIGVMNDDPKQSSSYYFQKDKTNNSKLTILKFTMPLPSQNAHYFVTECLRQ